MPSLLLLLYVYYYHAKCRNSTLGVIARPVPSAMRKQRELALRTNHMAMATIIQHDMTVGRFGSYTILYYSRLYYTIPYYTVLHCTVVYTIYYILYTIYYSLL